MSLKQISKNEFHRAIQSRLLWLLSLLFISLVVVATLVYLAGGQEVSTGLVREPSSVGLLYVVTFVLRIFIPLLALAAGYAAFSAAAPIEFHQNQHRTKEVQPSVWLGTVLGRATAVAVPVFIGMGAGVLESILVFGTVHLNLTLQIGLASLLLVLAYTSLIVGIAAISNSITTSRTISLGTVLVLEVLWVKVILPLTFIGSDGYLPAWTYPVSLIPPGRAYLASLAAVNEWVPAATKGGGPIPPAALIETNYGTPWLGVVLLALWMAVPLLIGHWVTSRHRPISSKSDTS